MNSFSLSSKIFFLLLLLSGSPFANCQIKNDSIHKAWVTAGLVKYLSYNSAGSGYNIIVNNLWNKFLWKVRFVNTRGDEEKFTDFGMLFGGAYVAGNTRMSISGGLALVAGTIKSDPPVYLPWSPFRPMPHPELKSFSSVDIPVEAQMSFLLSRNIGIGISLFADLNFRRSFYGISCYLELGRLK